PCADCGGSGRTSKSCPGCGGSGRVKASRGRVQVMTSCRACDGTGRVACSNCHGAGVLAGTRRVTVRIPPGADDGSRLRVPGLGRPGAEGGPPGDLLLETRVHPHPYFRRDGLALHLRLPLTVDEAYLGASVDVPALDGRVTLKVPPRSQSGQRLRL